MKYARFNQLAIYSLLLCFLSIVPQKHVFGQNIINLEVEFSQTLENAQVLSLTELGVDQNLNGPVLVNGYLENLTSEKQENLFFEIDIHAAKWGTIVEMDQKTINPFSLSPMQAVYVTNNDFGQNSNTIPGIEEEMHFTGGLTPAGDEFLNSLGGTTTLPSDIYTVNVNIVRRTNTNGREVLASASAQLGATKTTFEASEIYLKSPGDIVGSGAEITNPYPQFSWEGEANTEYRLLVVEANGQDNPESLLQSAQSSSPKSEGGSLLQFENLDVMVDGNSYQFPSSGAQPLEGGNTYHWMVLTNLQTPSGTQEVSSVIWSFKLLSTVSGVSTVPTGESVNEAIRELVGDEIYNQMMDNGYTLEGIEYDGVQMTGPAAVQLIEQIVQQIRDGEIILGNN